MPKTSPVWVVGERDRQSPQSRMKLLSSQKAIVPTRPRLCSFKPRGGVWTDEELLRLGSNDIKYELWNGKIIAMPPAGPRHGAIISRLLAAVASHAYLHKLGEVFDAQTGFRLSVDHCFEPDISFVSRRRLKLILPDREKLFHAAPDLAVEVISPSDSITRTERKLHLCLEFGSSLAWLIDPKTQTVRVYRPKGESELLRGERMLTGNSVLPGFRISLGRLFEPIGN
jgi:Uma2 family endonuclease